MTAGAFSSAELLEEVSRLVCLLFFHVVFAVPHLVLQICTRVMIRTVAAQEEARATILTTRTQLTLEAVPRPW